MTDPRALAVDYLRWFIKETRAASPVEVRPGLYGGHTFQVQLPGRPGANRTLQVDGMGPWFRIVDLWDEANGSPATPPALDINASQLDLFGDAA